MSVTAQAARYCATGAMDSEVKGSPRDRADAVLVAQSISGEALAFEELVRRYRNDVFGLAFHFMRNREEAWDISQEVFIKAHRGLKRFRGDASFKTWLMRITANQCKDSLKRRRLETVPFNDALEAPDTVAGDLGPERSCEAQELGATIESAIESLPVKHRTAFVLREFEGLTYEEMARVMECSLGTVMSRLHHARKKLQSKLLKMGVAGGHGV